MSYHVYDPINGLLGNNRGMFFFIETFCHEHFLRLKIDLN